MTAAFVALGSNLHDPRAQVRQALQALAQLPSSRLLTCSHLYLTPPWGVREQPPFINAVARLDTALTPHGLLDALLDLERAAGRVREGQRWGPRVLDLDVLHMAGVVLADARLQLPHPRIRERAFVLLPLHELAPGLWLPGQGRVADLLAAIDVTGCKRLPRVLP